MKYTVHLQRICRRKAHNAQYKYLTNCCRRKYANVLKALIMIVIHDIIIYIAHYLELSIR